MRGRAIFRPWGGRASLRLDVRAVAVFAVLALVSFAGVVANVGVGEYPIPPLDVVLALFGVERGDGNYGFIVNVLRLPRALVAVLVGAALAVAGAILQGLTKNDLAAPDIVGINAGAGLAAVTLIVAFPSVPAAYCRPRPSWGRSSWRWRSTGSLGGGAARRRGSSSLGGA
ncbi:MAG TPA: iron chelate uptake ABC transporter family permease subunit [Rubrobacter sp.]|nr:iron chelate uptake ABC transporter family permease subunit [Rubrobacter sp.]